MAIATTPVSYRSDEIAFTGLLCLDDATDRVRPGVLLLHGGAGLDEHARAQARRYAGLGYAVFACDLFGDGVSGDRERVLGCLMRLRDDPAELVERGQAGLRTLQEHPTVGDRIAVVGFCFGGLAALALARAGTAVTGAVSVHGSVTTNAPARPGAISARILVCHGSADPHVPMDDLAALALELDAAGADWQAVVYGEAQHGFTHEHSRAGAQPGVAYDARADERSFADVRGFLTDVLDG
jgi:dienelactone hydrolase